MTIQFLFACPDAKMKWFFWGKDLFGVRLYRIGPFNIMVWNAKTTSTSPQNARESKGEGKV